MADYFMDLNGKVTKKGAKKEEEKKKNYEYSLNLDGSVTKKEKGSAGRTWFNKGAFADGYQFGDVAKTILGTKKDVRENLYTGVIDMAEKTIDAGAYLAGGVGGLFGADEFKEKASDFIQKDLIDEKKVAGVMDNLTGGIPAWISQFASGAGASEASVLGDKSDGMLQSAGQLAGTTVLQSVGVPWYLTTGVTGFGGQTEEALREGATYGKAGLSGLISAGAEILTEKLSGGIKFGGKTLDEVALKPLVDKISSKAVRTLVNLGLDATGEGFEEVVSSVISNLGTALYKEEDLAELLTGEEAVDEYIESFFGGMALGGVTNVGRAVKSIGTGRDYKTGLTENEQKAVEKEVKNRVSEQEPEKITPVQQKVSGLEDIGPIRDDIAPLQQSNPVQEDIGPIRKDIATVEQAAEKTAPISQQAIKKSYEQSEDKSFYQFVVDALSGKLQGKSYHKLSQKISKRMANDIESLVGFSVEGYSNEISPDHIKHIEARHGANGVADHSMENLHDVARMGYVIDHYDKMEKGELNYEYKNSDGSPSQTVVLKKKIDDNYYYVVEAVPDAKRKTLHVVSAYINKNDTFPEVGVQKALNPDVRNESQSNVSSSNISIPQNAENASGKEIAPVQQNIQNSEEIPNTEENAPVGQTYSPDELPTWDDVVKKKPEKDTYAPEPESYPKKKVTTVKERNAAKLQSLKVQLKNEQDIMEKSHASYNAEIRDLQSLYDSKKNKNTKTAQELLDRIERRKNSRDNVDAYYEKRINDIKTKIGKMNTKEFKIVEQRQSKEEEYQTMFGDLIGDTSTWVDKKMGIYYKVNTLRRNLRDIVRDENGNRDIAKADAIYDELQGKYNHNEAKLNREANEIRGKYAELKITAEEDAYIQMLGEYRHNPDTTLTADVMKEYFEKHKKKIDTDKVDKIIASARQLYDELFRRVNATLEEQGMRPIEYREGYFPHFTDDKQSWLAKLLNWKTRKDEIPTDIAGLTEQFKPVRSYQSFDKHRTGDNTDYSFKKGLDMYVQGALDWIYHIEDIQKRRAFENEIRYRHSDQGIKEKVEAIRNNPEYDASEVQDQIDLVYKEARNPLNNFISDFRTQTNTLAGKKSSMDRGTEEWTNRKFYSTVSNISNRVTANMVVGSFSSALTNFIPITQSWAEVSPGSSLLAMRDTIKSYIKKDSSAVDNSDFLTNRLRKSKKLYQYTWDKAIDKFGFMMEAVDNFTSQVVWRSKYLENMNAGMSENEAIKNADQFAENVMAGRSRGNNPTIFDAKNPFIKIATAFQLEVNNQYGYLFKDVPQELRNEVKGKLVAGYAKVFIGAWVYNLAYSALTGRDAALDPIGIIEDLLKDLGLGDDEEPEEPAEIIGNLTESVAEELPFVGGLLGGGRIPISSALPYDDSDGIVGAVRDFSDDVANWKDGGRENFLKEMANPASYLLLPAGGGQAKKTIQGLGMFSDKHPIAGSYTNSGKLRFSVEDTPLSRLQAALFGQWSSQNAREYIEEGRSPLGEKQTQELVDTGLPMADYWKYRDGLKEQSGTQEKIEYIAGLDLPIATKNILVNNAVDRKTPVDLTEYDNLSGYEEFDFFSKNKELYNFLQENGVSYWDYKILGEDVQDEYKALQKDSRKQKFLQDNGVSVSTYCSFSEWEKDAYDWAYKNPEEYKLSQVITKDVVEYKRFTAEINNLTSDKDAIGKTISGSKKKKVTRYINNLNIDYGQKLILFRSLYESDDTYNYEIVEYLNGRDDISRTEMENILESLGFVVHKDGRVTW